ncbi:MAG: phenylalanine--tRNA ligase subunit beta [Candidatus Hodarchaeales archaeon]|jgi:phenylalanyl-tRNA synthetase beta chain
MPTYTLSINDFNRMLGDNPTTIKELQAILPEMGVPVKGIEEESIHVEVYPNRPDMLGVEGLARGFAGKTERILGLPEFKAEGSDAFDVFVPTEMEKYRPYLAMVKVTNLNLNDEELQSIFTFHEKLHTTHARYRKKASIGLYDIKAGKLEVPLKLNMVKADDPKWKFIPLDETQLMTPAEMTKNTAKGRDYAHLVPKDKMPGLIDKNDQILSIIPILNSNDSRVTSDTTELFVDCTGTDYDNMMYTFNMVITALIERGGIVHPATIHYEYDTPAGRSVVLPDFAPSTMKIKPSYINKKLGKKLSIAEQIKCLEKSRFGVKKVNKNELDVKIPCYRTDILHPVDFIEEIAIAYGYSKFTPTIPDVTTIGEENIWQILKRRMSNLFAGIGAYEVMTYMLTNEDKIFTKMNLPTTYDDLVIIANPLTTLTTICRNWLLPSLMEILTKSKSSTFPQRLFEMAKVTHLDQITDTNTRDDWNFCYVESSAQCNFNNARAALKTFENNLDIQLTLKTNNNLPYLISGRSADIYFQNKKIGFIGEIHPQVLVNWGLDLPVVCFEIETEPWYTHIRKGFGYDE